MRALVVMPVVLLIVIGISLVPSFVAEEDPAVGERFVLFFSAQAPNDDGGTLLTTCGEKPLYNLTGEAPPSGKAHLSRSAVAALSCATDFDFFVTDAFTVVDRVRIRFPLSCEFIGVAQSLETLGLESVSVSILKNKDATPVANGDFYVSDLPVELCMGSPPFLVDITTQEVGTNGLFHVNDTFTARVSLRAVNTEPALLPYWYLGAGASANVTMDVVRPDDTPSPATTTTDTTEPTPTETTPPPTEPSPSPTSPSPSPTSHSPASPTPTGSPPSCQRDDPESFETSAAPGQGFSLRARCSDADDDLDSGQWRVDDQAAATQELGDSPSTAEREFVFDDEGTHQIRFVPRDEAGHIGAAAAWRVTVSSETPEGSGPSCQRDDPEAFAIERPTGDNFTLRARCTDADDDLDDGEWRVDGDPVATDDLGPSPATSEHEFNFDREGTHIIEFVPRDEAGRVGSPATWRVDVTQGPAPTTSIPFFPSTTGVALATVGALVGAFLILRRRSIP